MQVLDPRALEGLAAGSRPVEGTLRGPRTDAGTLSRSMGALAKAMESSNRSASATNAASIAERFNKASLAGPCASRGGSPNCSGPAWICATGTRRTSSAPTAWPWRGAILPPVGNRPFLSPTANGKRLPSGTRVGLASSILSTRDRQLGRRSWVGRRSCPLQAC